MKKIKLTYKACVNSHRYQVQRILNMNTSRDLYYSARLHTYLQGHCHRVTHINYYIKC